MTERGHMCFVDAELSPRNLQVTCDRHCKQHREVNTRGARLDRHEKWLEWKEYDGRGRFVADRRRERPVSGRECVGWGR